MIHLIDNLWIGIAPDLNQLPLQLHTVRAVLNVAHDLHGTCGWNDGIEYAQVGLIDGPGNSLEMYCAAVLALTALLKRHRTLVVCHGGGRSLAVALMYINLFAPRSWDECLNLLRERVDGDLPVSHEVHRIAFAKINWPQLLLHVTGG